MDGMLDPHDRRLAEAWETLKAHYDNGDSLKPESNRLAFADPEFLLRRETRGLRMQMEMLKPDLAQIARGIEHTVVVFGSARFRSEEESHRALILARAAGNAQQIAKAEVLVRNARYYEQSRALAHTITKFSEHKTADQKLFICTGGGPGIMEAANRGAQEAGGISVGLNIALPHEQSPNPHITPDLSFKFHYFALRKMHFMMRAKALVAFPGGFGTLDELFETLTLVQCKKAKPVPIVLFGSDYWQRLLHLDVLVDEGVISKEDLDLFTYVDSVDDAWNVIRAFYQL
ncbi:TIGR00730 family Rossman fold protein [Limnohabitans sp.]|uniref:LOG family protein n=1 Tax=Limnohabitans sp. TaxID=1907725 RepID=UPI00286F9472|nr:TIGR00730 family Rossman fold protein [Limnohabitans sp.]